MRIAWFGSSLLSAYWNGAATYYRGIIRALHQVGCQVTFYEPDAYGRQQNRDIREPDWAKVVVYRADSESGPLVALDSARDADVLIKSSGVGVFDELLDRAVLDRRRSGTLVAYWDVDAPATLDRVQSDPSDPFADLIKRYDIVFTYGGGDPVVRAYKACGARECVPIYNALDPETHFPTFFDKRFEADLSFLGNRLPDREARVEEFFLRPAAACPEAGFLLGGAGWQDRRMPPNVRYAGHVYTRDHNAFNSSARMVLNISRDSMARYGFSPATRVFEAAGASACIVTDHWEGVEMFLEPEREILVAVDGADVAGYVQSVPQRRALEIGQAARKRVLAEHTYSHRAQLAHALLAGARVP
jgi:spore maturation protein CgeB